MRQRKRAGDPDGIGTASGAQAVGQRKNNAARCPTCGLHTALCVCASMPRFALGTKLLIVQHHRERHKPTNTARIGLQMFADAQMIHYGARDTAMDSAPLCHPDHDYILLFPGDQARPLNEASAPRAGRIRTLVVLDGTWHQCSRMARRAALVAEMPRYTLPEGPPSRWRIRKAPRPEAL
ncbi:MAG TPA: DTW domain-containing protein, partial [Nannocystis exedens]|nr:DTW domain-containing protein [Nannocystis exedens]